MYANDYFSHKISDTNFNKSLNVSIKVQHATLSTVLETDMKNKPN